MLVVQVVADDGKELPSETVQASQFAGEVGCDHILCGMYAMIFQDTDVTLEVGI